MQVLNVTGMTCGGCAKSVEKAVLRAAPEAAPKVDLAAGKVSLADGIDTGRSQHGETNAAHGLGAWALASERALSAPRRFCASFN